MKEGTTEPWHAGQHAKDARIHYSLHAQSTPERPTGILPWEPMKKQAQGEGIILPCHHGPWNPGTRMDDGLSSEGDASWM